MASIKKRLWLRLIFFLIFEALIIYGSMFLWGFTGKVGPQRFKTMLQLSTQPEKELLSDALNFYYNRGLSRYTSGILLRCDPEVDSMMDQFMWFHRNVASYYIFDDASYHEVIVAALDYFDLIDDLDPESVSTWYLERRLVNWQLQQEEKSLTDKDKNSLLLTLLDTGGSFLLGSNAAGLSIAALNILHKSGSDPAKAVPGIVVFKKQREIKFLWTVTVFTIANLLCCFLVRRKRKK